MFINPMWYDEVQRIGKKLCSPKGYLLHVISDLIGLLAIVCLIVVPVYLIYIGVSGTFTWPKLWLLIVPFAIAIVGNLLYSYSWYLADKRNFKYDYEKRISTWIDESGHQQSYKYRDTAHDSHESARE